MFLRQARGEVAVEALIGKLGSTGRASQKNAEAIFDVLGRLASKHTRVAEPQLAIAQRAAKLKPEASDELLRKIDGILRKRSGSAAELLEL